MFDAISRSRPRRPAAGTAVSLALHAVLIGVAVWFTAQRIQEPVVKEPILKFFPGPRGAPAPSPRGPTAPPRHATKAPRPSLMQPSATPAPQHAPVAVEPPIAAEVDEATDSGDELPGAVGMGVPGGSIDGVSGGLGRDGSMEQGPRPFEEGQMTPPQRLSGPDPAYTVQALENEVEGTMAVRCVVTERGVVHGCRVIRSLPYMDAAVVHALEQRRYTPARVGGQAVAVDYLFQIHLRLPAP